MPVRTTVIGSLPIPFEDVGVRYDIVKENFHELASCRACSYDSILRDMGFDSEDKVNSFFESEFSRYAVNLQVRSGVNTVTYGQFLEDMNYEFAGLIHGFDGMRVVEEIDGTVFPNRLMQRIKASREMLARMPDKDTKLKVNITGPATLIHEALIKDAFTPAIKEHYPKKYRDKKLFEVVGIALGKIAKEAERYGAQEIQIDEPVYSTGAPMNIALAGVWEIIKNLSSDTKVYLHSCGVIQPPVYKKLLAAEGINGFSFEFAGHPENMENLKKKELEANEKKLLFGCVRSDTPKVDYDRDIKYGLDLFNAAVKKVGRKNIDYINPDCGLKGLGDIKLAVKKLDVLNEIALIINQEK